MVSVARPFGRDVQLLSRINIVNIYRTIYLFILHPIRNILVADIYIPYTIVKYR